jgi:hypothetical protein
MFTQLFKGLMKNCKQDKGQIKITSVAIQLFMFLQLFYIKLLKFYSLLKQALILIWLFSLVTTKRLSCTD